MASKGLWDVWNHTNLGGRAVSAMKGRFHHSKQTVIQGHCLKILACIMDRKHPSIRELRKLCGIQQSTPCRIRGSALKRLGLIDHEPRKARTLHATVRFIPAEDVP